MDAPAYRWRIRPGHGLTLAGPLHRPPSRQRRRTIPWTQMPGPLRDALARITQAWGQAQETPADEAPQMPTEILEVAHRTLTLIAAGPDWGMVLHHSRARQRLETLWNFLAELESSLDALPEAFVLFDRDDRLLLANEQYYGMYPAAGAMAHRGVPFTDIAARSVRLGEFVLNEDPQAWLKRRVEFHRNGVGFFEQRLQSGRWIRLSERRTRSGGIVSVRVDITPLKERERALRRAMRQAEFTSRSMSRFLAVFSHEMRNGLNGILGTAQMLALDAATTEQQVPAQALLDACTRLSGVMTDLLEYLKNEASGVTIVPREMDPHQPLIQVRTEFSAHAERRGLQLVCLPAADAPAMVVADAARITQVLANLVSNAIKYSDQGRIKVSASHRDGMLRYEVVDEGRGIAPDRLAGLFEFFVSSSPDNPESTGLGLAISKQLVNAMGGVISVRSEPGHGSHFWFDIPAVPGDSPGPDRSAAYTVPATGLRVGIVDDDRLNCYVAEDFLRRLGHVPHVLANGDDALHSVRADRLDVLLLDLSMPDESGFDIAARLRAAAGEPYARLRIIAVTGNILPDTQEQCERAGMDAVMQKPLGLEALGRVLYATVRRPSLPAAAHLPAPAAESPGSVLDRLRRDIGERRYADACRSARRLLQDTISGIEEDTHGWPTLLHRVQGTAAQLGFVELGEAAHALEMLCRTQQGLAARFTDDYSIEVAQLDVLRLARAAIDVLDAYAVTPVSPSARRGSRSRAR